MGNLRIAAASEDVWIVTAKEADLLSLTTKGVIVSKETKEPRGDPVKFQSILKFMPDVTDIGVDQKDLKEATKNLNRLHRQVLQESSDEP